MEKLGKHMVRSRKERGAALVEFAIILPLLLLIVLGIVEFGWTFGQYNDIRHGAREAARLAAVNAGSHTSMGTTACAAMDLTTGATTIEFTDGGAVGAEATVVVTSDHEAISGVALFDAMLPSAITSTVKIRMEQPSTSWGSGTHPC